MKAQKSLGLPVSFSVHFQSDCQYHNQHLKTKVHCIREKNNNLLDCSWPILLLDHY